jgi:hypothetical protein
LAFFPAIVFLAGFFSFGVFAIAVSLEFKQF